MKICVSIASYRDLDLINTINSCYENAKNKDNLSFCVVSQAEEDEHPDLSHISNLYYYKYHWSQSRGLCWARNIAINKSKGDFILQIDSHSRFKKNWDETIKELYENAVSFWGEKIILTQFPDAFEIIDGQEKFIDHETQLKTFPTWQDSTQEFVVGEDWDEIEDQIHGDEVFYLAGGCTFASSKIYKSVAPDPDIYFEDQMSIAIRAYSRGLRLITPPECFMYSNYDRESNGRHSHWDDHDSWGELDSSSFAKLSRLYRGEIDGFWGIKSNSLYKQFIKILGASELEPDYEEIIEEEVEEGVQTDS